MIHIFHKWESRKRDYRHCTKCGREQKFSAELGGWFDEGYLAGTSYDGMQHVNDSMKTIYNPTTLSFKE